jgi:hypothetical protein
MNIIKKEKINYPKMYYKINNLWNTACDFFILKNIVLLNCFAYLCYSVTE